MLLLNNSVNYYLLQLNCTADFFSLCDILITSCYSNVVVCTITEEFYSLDTDSPLSPGDTR